MTGAGQREDVRSYYRTVAPFLERECAGRHDRAFWEWVAGSVAGGSIVELGAGSGRVTEILAKRAREVVATDISREMLDRARSRLRSADNVRFLEADMTELRLGRSFDMVVAANDPVVHLLDDADRDATMETAAAHLEVAGRFIFDGLWFPPERRERAAGDEGFVMERKACEGDELVVHQEWRARPEDPYYDARFEYLWEGRVLAEAGFRARLWLLGELPRRLALAGLAVARRWGGYRRQEWDPRHSRRLIVEARKVRGDGEAEAVNATVRGGYDRDTLNVESPGAPGAETMGEEPMDLTEKECVPCEGGVPPLTGEELAGYVARVDDGWQVVDEHHIVREFGFDDFVGALDFANRVGELAEEEGHHPDIRISWGKAEVSVHTHAIDGLSENDFILAAKIDELEGAS